MIKIKTSEIRQSFIDYFKSKDHKEYSSSPVIPFDDPTLMFTNAGMNQFKDIFTGKKKAEFPRAVTVQKCMRAGGKHNDLVNVGRTGRHHTFFEMLGNFSFGDYFKEEAIYYGWEWVTEYLKLLKDKLYVTVFVEDDDAFALWEKIAPELKNGRILRFDRKENYWSMGETGPNGPCSEIHFDRGEKYGVGPEHVINGETDRFVEIWNLVFMQFNSRPDGTTEALPKPSVDTGAGLERIACIMQNVDSNYETDIFKDLTEHISDITGKKYRTDKRGVPHRVIADHIRALTFCLADGGGISNEKQGYVLRRILRRAARHGRKLGMHEPFIWKLVPVLVEMMGNVYPEIDQKAEHIAEVIRSEEESFGRTLDTGLEIFDELARKIKKSSGTVVPGDDVFKLYDTYGFPVDLTEVMAEEQGLALDMDGFEQMMINHQDRSRAAVGFQDDRIEAHAKFIDSLKQGGFGFGKNTYFDRDNFTLRTQVLAGSAVPFPHVAVVLPKTPFYVEAGGQAGDHGTIISDGVEIEVDRVFNHLGVVIHAGEVTGGSFQDFQNLGSERVEVQVSIDAPYRWDIMRNHTATHLLHRALRQTLGEHVRQSGSYVGPDKLRFDFSHFKPMTQGEIRDVEKIVNDRVLAGSPVMTVEDNLENAKKSGAMAIFGEKYESKVRVVSIDDFSKELCGGTHVQNVSQIGPFMITLETAVASGVRRIEAVTGRKALETLLKHKETIEQIGRTANKPTEELAGAVEQTYRKLLELQKENKRLKAEKFSGGISVGEEVKAGNFQFRCHDFGKVESEEMAGWIDSGQGVVYPLVSVAVGMVNAKRTYMASASGAAKVHVGNISKEVLGEFGGRGGGKRNFAQGSVPSEVKSDDIFEAFRGKLIRLDKKG